jgi:predicted AlkP superfamily pyrophosphatase or phosphodiesterase
MPTDLGSHREQSIEALEAALCDPVAADRVEMVLRRLDVDRYRAAAVDGSVEFRRDLDGDTPAYAVTATSGRDPLANQSDDMLIGHDTERTQAFPGRTANAYPYAFDSIAQFFDAPHAADLVAVHTAAHHVGGYLGQHGSPDVVQARAPFLAAGAGIRSQGVLDRSTRVVDIAPTIAALLGLAPHPHSIGPTGRPRSDGLLRRQDGEVMDGLLDGCRAERVLVLLLDGCNANLLHDVIDAGEAPHIAGLVERGTAYRHGAMASFPTATLANHPTALTGAHPGHSGVLHNTWIDRDMGTNPDLLAMDQMFWAAQHLDTDVETLFEAIARTRPAAFSCATFEFCDRGADFSSFGLVRDRTGHELPPTEQVRHLDPASAEESSLYVFMSGVDHASMQHTLDCWAGVHGNPLPTLSWCSFALTDEAGHVSGPHGAQARAAVRDSDARIGEILEAVERVGATETTAVLLIGDHGMEQCDPTVDEPWDDVLAASGVPHREVGGGLIYLDEP